ncbi:MAG: hypothetical protein BMS9Abin31_0776 [Gammaproteobacteria bacterium]|nr:MAG: hypothetical protein BMS9Abin31_0776 [Gammaproteobacteria bacterium]
MSSEENIEDAKVLRTLMLLSGTLFGFFIVMIFLARTIVY